MLADTDKMPFGKYKGLLMQDVPVSYLHYIWNNIQSPTGSMIEVLQYIKVSMDALKMENRDLIFDRRTDV